MKMSDPTPPWEDSWHPDHLTNPLKFVDKNERDKEGWKRTAVAMAEILAWWNTPYRGRDVQLIIDDVWLSLMEEELEDD